MSPTVAFWVVVGLLFVSTAFFTVQVELRRSTWKANKSSATLDSGEKVELVTVVDGDEVSVKRDKDVFVIRLLGIKSFDGKVVEPGISEFGMACAASLRNTLGKTGDLTVNFTKFKKDKHNRVLAYLHKGPQDVGRGLVAQGHSLVLTAYPFDRETDYLADQLGAKTAGVGLWSSPKARGRAEALERDWQAKRANK